MEHYRVTTSPWRRAAFPLAGMLAWAFILLLIFSDPDRTRPGNLALMAVLLICVTVFAVRGWRVAHRHRYRGEVSRPGPDKVVALAAD